MPIDKKKYDVVGSKRMDRNLYIVLKDKRTGKTKLDKRNCKCPANKKLPCKCKK